jgi:hypothetical protein
VRVVSEVRFARLNLVRFVIDPNTYEVIDNSTGRTILMENVVEVFVRGTGD